MTFLTRTAGGESQYASILLVERGNPTITSSNTKTSNSPRRINIRSGDPSSSYSLLPEDSSSSTTITLKSSQHTPLLRNKKHHTQQQQDFEVGDDNDDSLLNNNMGCTQRTKNKAPEPPGVAPLSSPASPQSSLSSSSTTASPTNQHLQQNQQQQQQQQQPLRRISPAHYYARFKTGVAKRLDESVAKASSSGKQQTNRSADLVPLTHEYDKLKRRLRALIVSTKQYHEAMARMHRARMEVVVRLATVSSNTPLHEKIGGHNNATASGGGGGAVSHQPHSSSTTTSSSNSSNNDCLGSIHKLGFTQCRLDAGRYQTEIVDYVVEWERVVTTKVDASLDQVHDLQSKLHHYQNKVGNLRKKVHGIENGTTSGVTSGASSIISSSSRNLMNGASQLLKGGSIQSLASTTATSSSGIPMKLEEKLERNQQKLEQAWKEHETAASTLCNLLEEVTRKGWKDLAPLLDKVMEWEADRAMHDYKVFMRLSNLQHETKDLVQELEQCEVFDTPSCGGSSSLSTPRSSSRGLGGGFGAPRRPSPRGGGGGGPPPMTDIPVMVPSDNDDDDTESTGGSYAQFYPDDEGDDDVGSIESPPRSRSRGPLPPPPPPQSSSSSKVRESPTSFFAREIPNGAFVSSSSPPNSNHHVKQASLSSIVLETIE